MKFIYVIFAFILKVFFKFNDLLVDFSCKNNVVFNKGTRFSNTAVVHNISRVKSNIVLGRNSIIKGKLLVANYGGRIRIGDYVYVGENSNIWSGESIVIGNDVLISHNVNIIDTNSHEIDYLERLVGYRDIIFKGHSKLKGNIRTGRIIIEDNVWISFGVTVLKNVVIGKGSIVAAGSVVLKDVPPFSLVAGNPAKIIKKLN